MRHTNFLTFYFELLTLANIVPSVMCAVLRGDLTRLIGVRIVLLAERLWKERSKRVIIPYAKIK